MKKSVLRLITVCAVVAMLCTATLCFSLTSAEAQNLIVNGDFSNGMTGWTVNKMDGATVTNGQLVINQPGIDNGTVSASFAGTIKASTEYTIRYDATNVQNLEVKVHYTNGFGGNDGGMLTVPANQNYTFSTSDTLQAGDFAVEIGGARYSDVTGTLDNFILVEGSTISGDVTTPSSSESTPSQSATQPSQQGGSELTGNWVAMDAGQASLVSYSNGTLTLDATGGIDVKASQTLNLAAGSYRFSATKSGEPAPDLMVRTAAGDVPEGKYEEAGHVDFTLAAAGEVTLIVSEYRGGVGTLTNITLSGGSVQPTTPSSSETTPSQSTPSETQPSQQGGSELTGNWTAMDAGQASLVSYSNGTLTLDATGGVDVKASQTLNLAAGSYRFSATKSGEPSPDLMVRTAAGDVPEGKYEEAGHVDFTLAAAGEVTLIVSEYRGGIGTLTNITLSGGSVQPTTPSSSETTPSQSTPSETQPSQQGGSTELTGNWTAMDAAQASLVNYSNGTLTLDATGGVDVKASQTLNLAAGSYRFSATKSGEPSPDLMVRTAAGDVPEGKYEEAGHVDFTLAAAGEVTLIVSEYRGGIGTLTNLALSGGSVQPTTPSASQSGTQPSTNPSQNPGQTGKVVVWSGTINRDFTSKSNGFAAINEDALTQAFRNDIAANGVPTKYEIEAVANYVSGPSGYACYGFYQDAPYLEFWADKGGSLTKSTLSDAASLKQLNATAGLWLFSEGGGDITHIDSLTLYAYREGGTTESSSIVTDPSSSGTQPSQTPGQIGKVAVWSGNIGRDFTSKNTVAIVNVDELTQAFRNDIAANGIPVKYEIEAVASYTSGPSGYACWGFYQDAPYLEAWSDKGGTLNSALFTNAADLAKLTNSANVCLFSEGSGDITSVQSLTLYAYREGGSNPSTSETTPSSSETTPSSSETDPSTSETTPSQPTDGKVLVWAGNLGADFATADIGVAGMGATPIQNQEMMMAVMGELMTNGIPEKIEIKSQLGYLGGPSGFAAIGLYSNGQIIWPDNDDLTDAIFSNLSGLGTDTSLVVFSYGVGDTLHIDGMEIYAYRAQPSQSETTPTGIAANGDANGDGSVNMKDVLVMRKFLADLDPAGFDQAAADVTHDGVVNMKDVLKIRKFLADIEPLD